MNLIDNKWVKRESNQIGRVNESNPVKNRESNQVGNYESNQVGNGESNQVGNSELDRFINCGQCGTSDDDDGINFRYLKCQWAGS